MIRKHKYKKTLNIIGLLLITIAIFIPIYTKGREKHTKKIASKQIEIYLDKTSIINETKNNLTNNSYSEKYEYIAILEIPDINLLQGLLPLSNKYNNVEYNVQVINGSQMPDIPKTNLILASHSGTSSIAYFKNLEKLQINSEVYLYYQGYKYIYKIDNYYILPKTGTISINRDKYKNTITLITCVKENDNEQIAYIGYLTNKIKY